MIDIEIKGKGCLKLKPKQIKGSLVSKFKNKNGLKLWLTPLEGVPAIQSPCHPHVTPIKGMAGHNFENPSKDVMFWNDNEQRGPTGIHIRNMDRTC